MEIWTFCFRGCIVVPQCDDDINLTTDIVQSRHDPPAADHQGAAATYSLIARTFFWHGTLHQIKK